MLSSVPLESVCQLSPKVIITSTKARSLIVISCQMAKRDSGVSWFSSRRASTTYLNVKLSMYIRVDVRGSLHVHVHIKPVVFFHYLPITVLLTSFS